jgi:hypothetical protein
MTFTLVMRAELSLVFKEWPITGVDIDVVKDVNVLSLLLYRPPLFSSSQSFWLQSQRPGFHSRHYQIF